MGLKLNFKLVVLVSIIAIAIVLRFYKLGTNPPGLYWDEAVFGYDAYSILKTGHDHHGRFLPLFFESFGDWKLPVYHYLLVPSIAIWGLNEFAVRFPSALLGTLTVLIFYFLVKKLTNNLNLSLFCTLFLAVSPWHIQFSRGGFESTTGLFLVIFGLYLFLKKYFTFSFLIFALSMYSYHAYRIFTPLLVTLALLIYWPKIKVKITRVLPALVFSIVLLIPLIIFTFSPQGRARAISQSAFKGSDTEAKRIDYDQKSKKPLRFLSKYLYHEPLYYSYLATKAYLDHFSPFFLFSRGDQIGRHSQVDMGQIYLFEAIFITASFFALRILQKDAKKLMLAFLIISPIPAIIVLPTPHAYRTLQLLIPLAFLSGLGAYYFYNKSSYYFYNKSSYYLATVTRSNIIKICVAGFAIYFFISYLHLLFVHYPIKFGRDWQDGYRQLVKKLELFQNEYKLVYVTNIDQVPYIYLLFYQKYDPLKFVQESGTKRTFDKYVFVSPEEDKYNQGRLLYAAPSWEKVDGKWLAAVDDSAGRHLFSLWEINGQK